MHYGKRPRMRQRAISIWCVYATVLDAFLHHDLLLWCVSAGARRKYPILRDVLFAPQLCRGVHARTEKACTILTGLTMIACVMVIRLLEEFGRSGIALFLLAVGAVCVFAFCPLDTKEKPLAPDERQRYKKITEAITLLSITVALFAYYTEHNGILSSASVSVFVEGVLLIVGKMLKGQNEIPAMTENQV